MADKIAVTQNGIEVDIKSSVPSVLRITQEGIDVPLKSSVPVALLLTQNGIEIIIKVVEVLPPPPPPPPEILCRPIGPDKACPRPDSITPIFVASAAPYTPVFKSIECATVVDDIWFLDGLFFLDGSKFLGIGTELGCSLAYTVIANCCPVPFEFYYGGDFLYDGAHFYGADSVLG